MSVEVSNKFREETEEVIIKVMEIIGEVFFEIFNILGIKDNKEEILRSFVTNIITVVFMRFNGEMGMV